MSYRQEALTCPTLNKESVEEDDTDKDKVEVAVKSPQRPPFYMFGYLDSESDGVIQTLSCN